jgi:hypothetical protein
MLIHMTPHPKLFKRKGGAAPEPEDDTPLVVQQVAAELLKANNDAGGRPLPVAIMSTSAAAGCVTPKDLLDLLTDGHRVLPTFDWPTPGASEASLEAHAGDTLPSLKEWRLPLYFRGTQWESRLVAEPILSAPAADNPSIDVSGTRKVSVYGLVDYWTQAGTYWTDSDAWRWYESRYPLAALVIKWSNNEQPRLWPLDAHLDPRWVAENGDPDLLTNAEKRVIYNARWTPRLQALHQALKDGMCAAWQSVSRVIGYNAVGHYFYGRWGGHTAYSTHETGRISVAPTAWQGTSDQYYLGPRYGTKDYIVQCPQIEAMNTVMFWSEAEQLVPEWWSELLVWDGGTDPDVPQDYYEMEAAAGHPYTPERHRGMVGFGAYLTRPRTLGEYRHHNQQKTTYWDYWLETVRVVDTIWDHPILREFWQHGALVPNRSHVHPYQDTLHEGYTDADKDRWFLLDCTANPPRPWSLSTTINVYPIARVIGTAPNRRWLLYLHSPLYQFQGIGVTIPDVGQVTVNSTPGGFWYHITERDQQAPLVELCSGYGLQEPSTWDPVDWGSDSDWQKAPTWVLGENVWANTPNRGEELLVNGDFETGSPPDGWTVGGGAIAASVDGARTGGSGTKVMQLTNGVAAWFQRAVKQFTLPANRWFVLDGWQRKVTGNSQICVYQGNDASTTLIMDEDTGFTTWYHSQIAAWSPTPDPYARVEVSSATLGAVAEFDDLSVKALTHSELYAVRDTGLTDQKVSAKINQVSYRPVGLVLRLDSQSNPQNCVKVLLHYTTTGTPMVRLVKVVNGVYSDVSIWHGITFVANAVLTLQAIGTSYRITYNGVQIGTDWTVDEPTINSNTKHGLFSTSSDARLDQVTFTAPDWTPATPAEPQLWLETPGYIRQVVAGTGYHPANGQPLGWWQDRSRFARHFTAPADDARRPTYSTNIFGTQPAVLFDNLDDFLKWGDANSDLFNSAGPLTVCAVVKQTAAESDAVIAQGSTRLSVEDTEAVSFTKGTDPFESCSTPGAAAPINTPHILTVTRAGEAAGQTKVYVDGASLGNDAAVPAFPTGIAYLGVANGNTAYWQGYIAAVLVYHAVLSDEELANVHNYLAAKYGVTLTG